MCNLVTFEFYIYDLQDALKDFVEISLKLTNLHEVLGVTGPTVIT